MDIYLFQWELKCSKSTHLINISQTKIMITRPEIYKLESLVTKMLATY